MRKREKDKNPGRGALLALFCGATGIAFAPVFVRLSSVGPSATAFWRITLALPLLGLWMAIDRKRIPLSERPPLTPDFWGFFLAGVFFAGDLAVWHWSIRLTTVANATLLANFAPVFVTLFAWLLFRERVTSGFLAGMVIALLGTTLLLGSSFQLSRQYVFGDGLGLLTAVFYAGYILSVNRLRRRHCVPVIMTLGGIFCSLTLLVITLLSGEGLLPPSGRAWLVLLGLALVSQTAGQGLIAYALAYLPASFASVGLLLQPVLATVFAWMILREGIGLLQGVGGAVILVGIILAKRGSVLLNAERNLVR